ncbi:MAG: hypothetical protein DRR08_00850 [Candidatus Parabeggiatoa sp. nov. 2]|nr:MAG: hypothetical protein B6247_15460 [Beggiatoa sp. 4572_84]RKZ64356.1 MAG: hypothetical protein DRR08_00850 [Gammaproteobacteria bacterium]
MVFIVGNLFAAIVSNKKVNNKNSLDFIVGNLFAAIFSSKKVNKENSLDFIVGNNFALLYLLIRKINKE